MAIDFDDGSTFVRETCIRHGEAERRIVHDFYDDRVAMSSSSARSWSRGLAKFRALLTADVLGFSTEHLIYAELRINPLQGWDDNAKSTLDRELDARVRRP